jgi:hypothetical protein
VPFSKLKTRSIAAIIAIAAAVSPASLPASSALAYNEARPVLAYYHAWWDPANFSRTMFQPGQAYNSDDIGIMQQHVKEAQSAGIDGFVMSWYGNGDRTDTNLTHLLDIGQKTGFRATIHFETPHFWNVDDVVAQLKAFYDNHINHPAIVRYQGRPASSSGGPAPTTTAPGALFVVRSIRITARCGSLMEISSAS